MNVGTILKQKGRAVATAPGDKKLADIVLELNDKKIGSIVVVGDDEQVAGIISERDIIMILASSGATALSMPVSNVMTQDVVTCCETDTIEELMTRMTTRRFRHLPVIEDGKLVGIVSIGDVIKLHIAEVEMEASALRDYISTG